MRQYEGDRCRDVQHLQFQWVLGCTRYRWVTNLPRGFCFSDNDGDSPGTLESVWHTVTSPCKNSRKTLAYRSMSRAICLQLWSRWWAVICKAKRHHSWLFYPLPSAFCLLPHSTRFLLCALSAMTDGVHRRLQSTGVLGLQRSPVAGGNKGCPVVGMLVIGAFEKF
jgi:hypothetical protein